MKEGLVQEAAEAGKADPAEAAAEMFGLAVSLVCSWYASKFGACQHDSLGSAKGVPPWYVLQAERLGARVAELEAQLKAGWLSGRPTCAGGGASRKG